MSRITEQLRDAFAQAAEEARQWDARTEEIVANLAEKTAEELRDEVLKDPERHLRAMRSLAARPRHPCALVASMHRAVEKAVQAVEIEARLRASEDAIARLLVSEAAPSPLASIISKAIRPVNDRK